MDFPQYGVQPPVPRYLSMPKWNRKAMLCDDPDMGISWDAPDTPTFVANTEARLVNPKYWSHKIGGNIICYDGSFVWMPNFWDYSYPTSPDSYPNYYRGWPCSYYFGGWDQIEKRF